MRARALNRTAAIFGAFFLLGACMGEETGAGFGFLNTSSGGADASRDALSQAEFFGGDVVVRPPRGYCIDRRSLRRGPGGSFALLASCEALTGRPGITVEPALMTVSVMPVSGGSVQPTAAEITASMAPAQALDQKDGDSLSLVHLDRGGDGVLPGGDPRHWRAGLSVNGHIVALAVYARQGSSLAGRDGQAAISDLAAQMIAASPRRAAPAAAPANPPAGETDQPAAAAAEPEAASAKPGGLGALLSGLFPKSN